MRRANAELLLEDAEKFFGVVVVRSASCEMRVRCISTRGCLCAFRIRNAPVNCESKQKDVLVHAQEQLFSLRNRQRMAWKWKHCLVVSGSEDRKNKKTSETRNRNSESASWASRLAIYWQRNGVQVLFHDDCGRQRTRVAK